MCSSLACAHRAPVSTVSASVKYGFPDVRATLFALVLVLSVFPPTTSLRIFTTDTFLIQSVCVWAPRNATSRWKVRDGDLLLAVARLVRARAAPATFLPVMPPLPPQGCMHAAVQLAHVGMGLSAPTSLSLSVPSTWPSLPVGDEPPPQYATLSKVFTKMHPIRAPPREPLVQPSSSMLSSFHWDESGYQPTPLCALRRSNFVRLVNSESDHAFWTTFRELTSDKPRPPRVSAEQLYDSFQRRMNPPLVFPSTFNVLQHSVYNLRAKAMSDRTSDPSLQRFFSQPFSIADIESIKDQIQNKGKSATGLDNVSYNEVLDIPSEQLRNLFQHCVDDFSVPQAWLTAIIAAVKKPKNNPADPESYRTIGLESCLLKTLTLLIDRRLREWAQTSSIIPDEQSSFRKGHRPINNVFALHTLIDKARHLRRPLYVVYLDLSNAYPSVDQPSLWTKLADSGAQGPMIDWLRLLYANLSYVVRWNGETTECFRALAGILTGDPASPILWILFLADLRVRPHPDDISLDGIPVSLLLLADNILLVTTSREAMQTKLRQVQAYCDCNFLSINVAKTFACIFGPLPSPLLPLWLHGETIRYVQDSTYVGVTLSTTTADIFAPHYARKAQAA